MEAKPLNEDVPEAEEARKVDVESTAAETTDDDDNDDNTPPFQLKLEPPTHLHCLWRKEAKVVTEFKLINITEHRQIFKVHATSDKFHFRPATGCVDAGEQKCIRVTFTSESAPPNHRYKFTVNSCKYGGQLRAREAWSKRKPEGAQELMMHFENDSDDDELSEYEGGICRLCPQMAKYSHQRIEKLCGVCVRTVKAAAKDLLRGKQHDWKCEKTDEYKQKNGVDEYYKIMLGSNCHRCLLHHLRDDQAKDPEEPTRDMHEYPSSSASE
ncbi:unnamed protein product, partial [Mesorhabditis spiculigera]